MAPIASAYVPVAHYWIELTNAEEYKSAIAAQQILVDRSRVDARTGSLLSIAESSCNLATRITNRTLGRLIKDYPDSEAAKVARERLPATR